MSNEIAFIISISAGGSGYTPAQQNNYNVAAEMRANGFSLEEIAKVIRCNDLLYDLVRAGGGSDGGQLDAVIRDAIHYNAKLKDWLPPLSSEIDWKKRDQWFLALDIDLNPVPLWEKFDGPVFGIFGELDNSPKFSKLFQFWGRRSRAERRPTTRSRYFPKQITISCKQRRAATMSSRA